MLQFQEKPIPLFVINEPFSLRQLILRDEACLFIQTPTCFTKPLSNFFLYSHFDPGAPICNLARIPILPTFINTTL